MDKIDSRLAQVAILLQRQYLLLRHLIDTTDEVRGRFEASLSGGTQNLGNVLGVYNYVFALVDHLVRYEKIASGIPKLNQKSAEFRSLDTAMGDLKEIRNQLQHINNDVENTYSGPLLGAVCWVSEKKQYIACLNDVGRERSSPGIILDTHRGAYLQDFCYVYD
ncbi:MAG TPA: hypothetical protein VN667_23240, partial [Burkholderiales bacterium]|nr:hypothetical protein [Burkholderiales bacterium]